MSQAWTPEEKKTPQAPLKGRQKTHLRAEIDEELDFYLNPGEGYVIRNSDIFRKDGSRRD